MESLPGDMMTKLLLQLDYEHIINLGRSSKAHTKYVTSTFWKTKVFLDYPGWAAPQGNLTWGNYYLALYSQHYVAEGSEKFIHLNTCLARSYFRNSKRLIDYFNSLKAEVNSLESNTRIFSHAYLAGRYLSPSLQKNIYTENSRRLTIY
jgi:hypothetical protein